MPDAHMLFCLTGVALVAAGLVVFGGWVEHSTQPASPQSETPVRPTPFDQLSPDTLLEFVAVCVECGAEQRIVVEKRNYNREEMKDILAGRGYCTDCRDGWKR